MDNQVTVELSKYADIKSYKPQAGDVIIRHGWAQRTKWFGVVNYVDSDGFLHIIKEGSMKLLLTTSPDLLSKKSITIRSSSITLSWSGTYTIMQTDSKTNAPIWYI